MNYYIKQKVFSWNDKFSVKDKDGNDVFQVSGEFFSWGKKLHLLDGSGNEVLYIEQKVFNFLPTYSLYMGGEEVAKVRKEFSFLRPRYSIDGPSWEVEGSFWEHDYQIKEGSKTIADISKEWLTWGDSYVLDIRDSTHAILALGVIIVIDCVTESSSNAGNNN